MPRLRMLELELPRAQQSRAASLYLGTQGYPELSVLPSVTRQAPGILGPAAVPCPASFPLFIRQQLWGASEVPLLRHVCPVTARRASLVTGDMAKVVPVSWPLHTFVLCLDCACPRWVGTWPLRIPRAGPPPSPQFAVLCACSWRCHPPSQQDASPANAEAPRRTRSSTRDRPARGSSSTNAEDVNARTSVTFLQNPPS